MPHSPLSLQVTRRFQQRVFATRARLDVQARRTFPTIDRLDGTDWPQRTARMVAQAQAEAVRAASGYLTAFLATETGRRTRGPALDSRRYAGLGRDGRPLSFDSPIIGVKAALKDGLPPMEALAVGLNRAARQVGVDYDHAHRQALLDAIRADDRFTGWNRATSGTCGACLAASDSGDGLRFEEHPNCECVSEPEVRDLPNLAPRLTGMALFEAMTPEHQNEVLGEETAQLVRDGTVPLRRLKQRTDLETQPGFITQAPVEALKPAA